MEAWEVIGGVACTRRADLHKLEGVGALEVHLEPFGGVCNHLESIGVDLEHLEAKGAIWRWLEEFCSNWVLVSVHWSALSPLII